MRRVVLAILIVLVLPGSAPAQTGSDPFQPPQVVVPTPTPQVVTPTPDPDGNTNRVGDPGDEPSRGLLLGVAGVVALLLAGIGFYITRDARRNLTDADKRALDRESAELTPEQRKQAARQKSKQRKKSKAQRQARKANRPR